MSEPHRTVRAKPSKPYPEFPLTAHPAGYWCKKIRGKIHYFGPWEDPDGALAKYNEQKDDLHAGRTPRDQTDGAVTVKQVVNAFLNFKLGLVDSGELSPATWDGYKRAAAVLLAHTSKSRLVSDLRPADFTSLRNKMAKQWGPHRLGLTIICIRSIFKYAFDSELIDWTVRFGPGFKLPSKKTLRLHRAAKGPKLFAAEEIRRMVNAATPKLRAMILLGINCGLGNSDCARLPLSALDLDGGWLDYPRPKTGMPRRCPLWLETVEALRQTLARRREPLDPDNAGLVFITRGLEGGAPYTTRTVLKRFAWLLRKVGINARKGLGFYTLRHSFRTIADEVKDQPAADLIMGHEIPHMSAVYRETISDERLRAVSDHVRKWLLGGQP